MQSLAVPWAIALAALLVALPLPLDPIEGPAVDPAVASIDVDQAAALAQRPREDEVPTAPAAPRARVRARVAVEELHARPRVGSEEHERGWPPPPRRSLVRAPSDGVEDG